MTTPHTTPALPLAQSLEYVITWLEGGCDPKEAAKELRLLQQTAKAAPEGVSELSMSMFASLEDFHKAKDADFQSSVEFVNQGAPASPQLLAPPPGWKITEEMHVAAVKVLHRAHGVDGLPQRMLDAMLAAAPRPPASVQPLAVGVEPEKSPSQIEVDRLSANLRDLLDAMKRGDTSRFSPESMRLAEIAAQSLASPQPPGGMVPLTEQERRKLLDRLGAQSEGMDGESWDQLVIGAVEAHHGIKEGS